jgi:hypothetical protein
MAYKVWGDPEVPGLPFDIVTHQGEQWIWCWASPAMADHADYRTETQTDAEFLDQGPRFTRNLATLREMIDDIPGAPTPPWYLELERQEKKR